MSADFSWVDIIGISGWSLWLVLGCNSFLLTLVYERLWYIWKPLQMRKRWLKTQRKVSITREEWEKLFFREQQRVHIGLPLMRNLIITCPLVGILGCLFNLILLLQQEGLVPFYTPSMLNYIFIRLALPVLIGLGSASLGYIALKLYVKGIYSFIRHYPGFLAKRDGIWY